MAEGDLIGRIKDGYAALRPAEQAVADAVLRDVEGAVAESNEALASRAGVSPPSVTRFCRAVGCDGVRDFKIQLARSLAVGEVFLRTAPEDAPADGLPPWWTSILGEARAALRDHAAELRARFLLRDFLDRRARLGRAGAVLSALLRPATLVPVARGILADKLAARRPPPATRIGRLLIEG